MKKIFSLILLLAITCYANAIIPEKKTSKHKIEVTAFYSDFVNKYDALPDSSWTFSNFIQVRIKQIFNNDKHITGYSFLRNHFLNSLVPDILIKSITLEMDSGVYHPKSVSELISKINDGNDILKQISYSYFSPTNLTLGTKYNPQSFYGMSMQQSWYVSNSSLDDTICVEFNIEPSLFYLRCSKPLIYVDGKATMYFSSKDEEPSFYLFYLPAYRHITSFDNKRTIDLLVENIDTLSSDFSKIEYRKCNNVADSLSMDRLKKCLNIIDCSFGRDGSPDSFFVVKSEQRSCVRMGTDSITYTFSRVHQENKYSLTLLSNSDYDDHTLMHELIHNYVKDVQKNNKNLYESFFFEESLVEYTADYLYEKTFGSSVFYDKTHRMLLKNQNIIKAKQLLKNNSDNYLSFANHNDNTTWIYYDLLPSRLHYYALTSGSEEKFSKAIVEYLRLISPNFQPTFSSFSQFMKERGFKKVERIYKL